VGKEPLLDEVKTAREIADAIKEQATRSQGWLELWINFRHKQIASELQKQIQSVR
jgi:hypothetical protein